MRPDLEWALLSPDLLAPTPRLVPALSTTERARLTQLTLPQSFDTPSSHAPKLGRYFESLLALWIEKGLGATRLHRGVVLNRGTETLGEMDFLFTTQEEPNITQHWEVAVKFYLFQDGRYLGPQGRDRLDLKLDRLYLRQLALAQTPEASAWIAKHRLPSRVESRAFVKGRLFYPLEQNWRTHPAPPEIEANHLRGWWSREFPQSGITADSRWILLSKLKWMTGDPATNALNEDQARAHCEAHFQKSQTALHWLISDAHGNETSRGMVVHPAWPSSTT